MKRHFLGSSMILIVVTVAHAQSPSSDMSGYQCYKVNEKGLHITAADAFAGRGFPLVFSEPSTSSKRIGITSEIEYVIWPLKRNNGFVEILRPNGQIGWVAETTLIPLRKSDGTIGGCSLRRQPDGLITFKLDPGVAVRF